MGVIDIMCPLAAASPLSAASLGISLGATIAHVVCSRSGSGIRQVPASRWYLNVKSIHTRQKCQLASPRPHVLESYSRTARREMDALRQVDFVAQATFWHKAFTGHRGHDKDRTNRKPGQARGRGPDIKNKVNGSREQRDQSFEHMAALESDQPKQAEPVDQHVDSYIDHMKSDFRHARQQLMRRRLHLDPYDAMFGWRNRLQQGLPPEVWVWGHDVFQKRSDAPPPVSGSSSDLTDSAGDQSRHSTMDQPAVPSEIVSKTLEYAEARKYDPITGRTSKEDVKYTSNSGQDLAASYNPSGQQNIHESMLHPNSPVNSNPHSTIQEEYAEYKARRLGQVKDETEHDLAQSILLPHTDRGQQDQSHSSSRLEQRFRSLQKVKQHDQMTSSTEYESHDKKIKQLWTKIQQLDDELAQLQRLSLVDMQYCQTHTRPLREAQPIPQFTGGLSNSQDYQHSRPRRESWFLRLLWTTSLAVGVVLAVSSNPGMKSVTIPNSSDTDKDF